MVIYCNQIICAMGKTLTLFLLSIFSLYTFSQTGIKNYGNTIINSQNNTIKLIDASLTNNNNGQINNDGDIYIEKNINNNTNNNFFSNNNNIGNVILSSNISQQIGGIGDEIHFENLIIENTSTNGVEITNNNQIIENSLSLNNGIISTNNYYIVIANSNSNAIINYSDQSFINGNLRRYITNNTETYAFPIGDSITSNTYYLAELKNTNIDGITYIDASFEKLIDTDFENITAQDNSSLKYSSVSTEGVWQITPDATITSGTYDLKLHINNISNLIDNRFAILSRENTSTTAADWDCTPCGIGSTGLNADYGEGRMLSDGYALRKGFNHFSQFGIAMAACPMPLLDEDTIFCYGNSINLYPGSFNSYLWSTGSTDSSITVDTSGIYYVNLTSNIAGCETASDTINVTASKIETNVTTQNITCYGNNNGLIFLNPTGGTPNYTYNWYPSAPNNDTISGLSPNSYFVTITDSNGCKEEIEKIEITQPDSLYLTADITENLCFNDSSARISAIAYGGAISYNYLWSNGSTEETISELTDGNYILTLTDANNCELIEQYTLASNATEIVINSETGIDNRNFGYIYTNVEGGTPDYNYYWSYDETNNTENAEHLYTGTYFLTITDANNCKQFKKFDIEMQLTIPTVITPNGDGYNDTWDIVNLETINDVNISIFNRWGDNVYNYSGTGLNYRENTSIRWNAIWKGKKLPLGSYVYVIKLDNNEEYNGVVTIVY